MAIESRSRIIWLVTTAMAIWMPAAHAQQAPAAPHAEAGTGDQDIIVTARKRDERLIDVPQSVSVISPDTLDQVHAQRFADYFTRVK